MRAEFEEYCTIENVLPRWGKGLSIGHIAPSRKSDERAREWFIIHRTDDAVCHVENARWLARRVLR